MGDKKEKIICRYSDERALYAAYMPFISDGGLFITTVDEYKLGSDILMRLQLLDEPEVLEVEGKVVWITPKGAQGGRPSGLGIQLQGKNKRYVRNKIETYLTGMLNSNQPTDTI